MLFLKLHILSYGKILIDGKRLISVVFTASFQIRNRDSYCAFSCDLNNNNCIIALSLESHHERRSRIWILDPFYTVLEFFSGGLFSFFTVLMKNPNMIVWPNYHPMNILK